jgi:glyoxylate reductase
MKSVFVTRTIPGPGIDMLRERGYVVDVYPKDHAPSPRELKKLLSKKPYDAVLTLLTDHVDAEVFDVVPTAKIIANYAIGYDNIDIVEAKKRGITVTNTPGDYAHTVAEHSIALILALTTRLVEADTFVRKGKYRGWSPTNFIGTDIKGKTLGLIGTGRIGEFVARCAFGGFGLSVVYHDIVRNERIEKECGAVYVKTLDELLSRSDIVSLHVPLLPSTHHLIDATRLAQMKPSAFLINTSRGPVVDEKALVSALRGGIIAGAGLDVFEYEPKLSSGLTRLKNVVLTPHIASSRRSARDLMSRIAAQNIIDVLEGGTAQHRVNP